MSDMISLAFQVAVYAVVFSVTVIVFAFIGMSVAFFVHKIVEWIWERGWKRE